ncbi:MAG TPA: hypothetical protein VI094_14590 [Propionibacteriaceae bacterium]
MPAFQVSVCGPSDDAAEAPVADRVGQLLADRGVVVICGVVAAG